MVNLDDYRAFLVRELIRRQNRNPAYTLAAFARDLKMSPQKLGQVINGRSGLSPQAALEIARLLRLGNNEHDLFIALVTAHHSRSRALRKAALETVKTLREQKTPSRNVEADDFAPISRWYHWAALHLTDRKDFRQDIDWVAQQLQIQPQEAIEAYEALLGQGLLKADSTGRWRRTDRTIRFQATKSNEPIRRFYRDILEKAQDAIENKPVEKRHYSVSILSINESDRERVKQMISDFAETLQREFLYDSDKTVDEVSAVAVQFIPLDNGS